MTELDEFVKDAREREERRHAIVMASLANEDEMASVLKGLKLVKAELETKR